MSREKQIENKACKDCIHYNMCLEKFRKNAADGRYDFITKEEYFAHADGCDFYADNRIYRKQEWISVDERLPEDMYGKDRKQITVLVSTKSGRVSTSSRVRMMMFNKEKRDYEYTDIFEWSGQIAKKVTHWMPLPEAPKMKGGGE